MKSKLSLLLLASAAALVSCGGGDATSTSIFSRRSIESWENKYAGTATETCNLTIWAGESNDSVEFVKMVAKDFKAANPQSNYNITIKPVSESSVSGDWEQNPSTAADLAIAADDQIPAMVSSNRLVSLEQLSKKQIPGLKDDIVGRSLPEAIEAVTQNDNVYAFPISASNGFVLYYNAKYIKAEDTVSFDKLLEAIHKASETAGRNLTFGYPYNSGWYLDGWFHGAGLTAVGNAGDTYVTCNWNNTDEKAGNLGKDVAGAMVKLAHGQYKAHWSADTSNKLMTRIADGSTNEVVATISGTWDYNRLAKAWGEGNAKASVLPKYHLDLANKDVQMNSVKGFKVAIINKNKTNIVASARFAEFMANYESQVLRYDMLNEAPANMQARELVINAQSNPVVKAINDQWDTSFVEKVNQSFWGPSNGLSVQLSANDAETAKYVVSGEGTANVVLNYDEIQSALDACINKLGPAAE